MLFKVGIALVLCLLVKDGRAVRCESCFLVYSEKEPSREEVRDDTVKEYTNVMYSGIFKTCDEMGFEDCDFSIERTEGSLSYRCAPWYNDDGDRCCSTQNDCTWCHGKCVLHWVYGSILVSPSPINTPWEFIIAAWLGQLKYETFSYPGYCKCA